MKQLMSVLSLIVLWDGLCRAEETLVLRTYSAQPNFMDVITESALQKSSGSFVEMGEKPARFTRTDNDRLKQYFQDCGVTYPEGSFVRYNDRISRLFVKNSEDNHALIKHLLYVWGILPLQVQLDAAWVSFSKKDLDPLALASPTATPALEDIRRLRGAGKGRILSASTTLTRSGVNAQLQAVDEIMYATIFGAENCRPDGTNNLCVAFSDLQTRETGVVVNFTPTVSRDLQAIDLTLVPELAEERIWQNEQQHLADRKLPQFRSRNIMTSVIAKNGAPLVMGGMPSKDGEEVAYLFITATLVDDAGRAIPPYDFDQE